MGYFRFIIQWPPTCPFSSFFSRKISIRAILLYHSEDRITIPCTPQLDVVMYAHLIRCHPGPEDVIQLRRSSSIFCAVSVGEGHLPHVVTARPGRCRFALEVFHDLVPHQLNEASLVIFASWPLKLRTSAHSCDTSRVSLVHAEPIALQLINHSTPFPSSFRGSHLDHVRLAQRMPGWFRQPASVFWVPAILELPEFSTPALHDSTTPSREPFHPLCGVEPASPAEPKLARLRQRVWLSSNKWAP